MFVSRTNVNLIGSCAPQNLIHSEIDEITRKIEALDAIKAQLEHDLLKLQEEELELDDECASPV